ncbi:MAG: SGNH/GDSL hydrolase family protein [Alcaligenaceae bacterium]
MLLTGLTVLVIGASHLAKPTYLIKTLHDELTERGAQVHSVGVCGVLPSEWLKKTISRCGGAERREAQPMILSMTSAAQTVPLATLLEAQKPDVVVIVMGDNLANYKASSFSRADVRKELQSLTTLLASKSIRCVWVGPAWGENDKLTGKTFKRTKEISAFLESQVKPCEYVNSLEMSKPGEWQTTDGQHFFAEGYQAWGAGIASGVERLP